MQVKICPKCNAENRPDRASCSNCYVSLEEVAITTVEKKEPVTCQAETQGQTLAGQPLNAPSNEQPKPAESPYGPPPGPPRPGAVSGPPFRENRQPIQQGTNWGAIILVVLLLAGGAFAGWWFFMKPLPPEQVVQNFFQAAGDGNYDKFKGYLTDASIEMIKTEGGGEEKVAEQLKQAVSRGQQLGTDDITFGKPTFEGENKALVSMEPKEKPQLPPGMPAQFANFKFEMVLLREGGKWKIDLKETQTHMMEQVKEMFKSMGGLQPR